MTINLVVTHPFADYAIGDRITDADKIKATVESNPGCVVRIEVSDEPQSDAQHQ